jgi:dienelactone hydrolase
MTPRSVRWRCAGSEDLQDVTRASRPAGSAALVLVRRWRDGVAVATLMLGLMTAGGNVAIARAATAGATEGVARPPRVVPIGTYGLGKIDVTFVDASRPTNANGSSPELASRTLRTAIYYPALVPSGGDAIPNAPPAPPGNSGRYPLILFSHGLGGQATFYVEVLKAWASAGYVVAAPAYPLSNINAGGGFIRANGFADVANQPADATFVINQVLTRQEALLGGIVAPKRIGASGHSLGGSTTYALGYSTCCRDRRVKAAIPMSACAGLVEDPGGYFRDDATPLLILHGDADRSYQRAVEAFAAAKPPKFGLTFVGAGHNEPFTGLPAGVQAMALTHGTVDFWDRYLKDDKTALKRFSTDVTVAGVTRFQSARSIPGTTLSPCGADQLAEEVGKG